MLEPEAVAVHLEDVDVVGKAIEQRAGQPLGAEDAGPLVERPLRRDELRRRRLRPSADTQGADSIDDASDESDDAEHDGERSEAFSAFVSGKGEKQQYRDERDKDHVTWHPFNRSIRIGYLHLFGGHETPALNSCT